MEILNKVSLKTMLHWCPEEQKIFKITANNRARVDYVFLPCFHLFHTADHHLRFEMVCRTYCRVQIVSICSKLSADMNDIAYFCT